MENDNYVKRLRAHYKSKRARTYIVDAIGTLIKFLETTNKTKLIILDAGCGIGFGSNLLSEKGYNVISLDINRDCLKYGKKVNWLSDSILADICNSPIKNCSFDAVISIEIIEHLKNTLDFLRELKRILKKDAPILITTPNKIYSLLFRKKWDPTHISELRFYELERICRIVGFKMFFFASSGIPILNIISESLARRIAHYCGKMLLKIFPFVGPSIWIIARRGD